MSLEQQNNIDDEIIEFKASELSISTCTIITNLNSTINLDYFSRFVPVYEQNHPILEEKDGGIYNIEYYGNCARGENLMDKIKDEFSNQATIKFKYWGFRHINIKIFMNGKLQMTGLKSKDESILISNLIIKIIQTLDIQLIQTRTELYDLNKMNDFQLMYDKSTDKVYYYRKKYDRYLSFYTLDHNDVELEDQNIQFTEPAVSDNNNVNLLFNNKSNYSHSKPVVLYEPIKYELKEYNDNITEDESDFLKSKEWYSDIEIVKIIKKIEYIKKMITKDFELLLSYKTCSILKHNIEKLIRKYNDFRYITIDKLLKEIDIASISNNNENEQYISDFKIRITDIFKMYMKSFEHKLQRLIDIRNTDVEICNTINQHILNNKKSLNNFYKFKVIDILKLVNVNYYVNDVNIVLINSDYSINHNLNLKKVSKLLKKKGYFNSYEPDDYPGVLTKYYYNPKNTVPGICNCPIHCSTKDKKSICIKITISVFRPGSIIITGARSIDQLKSAYLLIYNILKENIKVLKGIEQDDDQKQLALLNNEFRKISRKPRLFYIKKTDIINYPL